MPGDEPALVVNGDVATLKFPTDDYVLEFRGVSSSKYGGFYAEVTARHGEEVLHVARIDLLNQRDQGEFHQRCRAVNSNVADWQSRLQSAITELHNLANNRNGQVTGDPGAVWRQAMTARDFLLQHEDEVLADVPDIVVPGCLTGVSAPRASGKSLVALYLGVALASGGVFRGARLSQRRVLLVDRDNPAALVRKRLRWLGAHQVTDLNVLTRDKAPPLTDKTAWGHFPVADANVVIVDSLGAASEGVSEKEGKEAQEILATLKDLARRGPAVLLLVNTVKTGAHFRGRGELIDALDIFYEARNVTGWRPTSGDDWWLELPDAGEHAWQQRAQSRKGQTVLRVAFIASKFRLGIEPDPFVLEIDTRQEPWTLTDITAGITTAGAQAAEEESRRARVLVQQAETKLVEVLTKRTEGEPMRKREAENLLHAWGLTHKIARTLLEIGGNHDVSPAGRWVLRPIPPHNRATGVVLAEEVGASEKTTTPGELPQDTRSGQSSSDVRLPLHVRGTAGTNPAPKQQMSEDIPRTQPGIPTSEDNTVLHKQPYGPDGGGISSDALTPSSDDEKEDFNDIPF